MNPVASRQISPVNLVLLEMPNLISLARCDLKVSGKVFIVPIIRT